MFSKLSSLFYWSSKKILGLWIKITTLPEDHQSIGIDPNKPVCYIMESPSASNLIVLEKECERLGLPMPRAVLGEGELSEFKSVYSIYPRKSGIYKDKRTQTNSSEKIAKILDIIKQSDGELDVQFVSAFVMWGRSIEKQNGLLQILFSDTWQIAGRFKKFFTMLVYGRSIWLKFGHPISLQEQLDNHAWQGLDEHVKASFARELYHMRRAIIGPSLSNRTIMVNDILKTASVKRAMAQEVSLNAKSPEKAEHQARKYVEEIAATYSSSAIKVFHIMLNWLWSKIYDGVEVHNLETLQKSTLGKSVVYVPCHRSHIDYLLMSYVLYEQGLIPPHIAAGINLNLPLVGKFLRSSGAFFMRRSFRGNPLYAAVFNEYLHANFVHGVPVEYFVEGGRSRTGRMLEARQGMLQMTVRSYLRSHDRPMIFVPIYIGYEKLIESKTYVRELSGAKKKNESVFGLLKSLRKIRGSFGKVHVNFGEPIELSQLLDEHKTSWRSEQVGASDKPQWLSESVQDLANQVTERINDAAVVNPINIIAVSLLAMPKRSMGEQELINQIELFAALLNNSAYSNTQVVSELSGEEIIAYVEKTGLLIRQGHEMGDVLSISPQMSVMMTYFRNNVLHYFALPSLIASCFVTKRQLPDQMVMDIVKKIMPFLRSELTLSISNADIEQETKRIIQVLLDMGLLVRDWNNGDLRRPVSTTFKAMQLRVLAQNVKPMLERYYMGAFLLMSKENEHLTPDEFQQIMVSFAKLMSMLYDLNSPDYSDKNLFKHFLSVLKEQGHIILDEEDGIVPQEQLSLFIKKTKMILDQQVRHSIHQIIKGDVDKDDGLDVKLGFLESIRARRQAKKQAKDKQNRSH